MKRIWLIAPWALFIAITLAWVAYWHIVAGEAERRLEAMRAEQAASGADFSYARIELRGFPVLMRLELHDVAFAPARGGWRGSTARADLHIQLLNTNHVILEAQAPIAIARADGAVTTIEAEALIASMRTRGGALAAAGIEADNLQLDDPAEDGVLLAEKIVLNVRPDPRAAGEFQIAFDAEAVRLPRPVRSFESFGQDVSFRAAIVIEQAAALAEAAPADPLGPWREAGGRLRFEALSLNWGPLAATGAGHGGLDDQRRLEGVLELPIETPGPIFAALAEGENVDQSARSALRLLAAGFALSGDDINLDVEARTGVLRLEGLAVRTLPPVY